MNEMLKLVISGVFVVALLCTGCGGGGGGSDSGSGSLSAPSASTSAGSLIDSSGDDIDSSGDEVTPVPEPSTIALLGIGIAGLAYAEVRRRRKKKAVDNS